MKFEAKTESCICWCVCKELDAWVLVKRIKYGILTCGILNMESYCTYCGCNKAYKIY